MGEAAGATGGIVQGAGTYMAAQASAKAAEDQAKFALQGQRETLDETRRQFDVRQKAYDEALGRGSTQMGEAETALMRSLEQGNPEIAAQERDILSGSDKALQKASGQMRANLELGGVRGGQAATLMGRQVGEMGEEARKQIGQMKYSDSATREALRRAYLASKGQAGQVATLAGAGA